MYQLRYVFCICSLLATSPAPAQRSEKVRVYGEAGVGLGSLCAVKATLSVLLQKHHELSAGYSGYVRRGRDIPDSWQEEPLFTKTFQFPWQTFSAATISYGYVWHAQKKTDKLRYVLRGSIATGQLSTPVHYRMIPGRLPHWESDYADTRLTAFALSLVAHYTPVKFVGLSAGLYGMFSERLNGGGVTVGWLVGNVGTRARSRKEADR